MFGASAELRDLIYSTFKDCAGEAAHVARLPLRLFLKSDRARNPTTVTVDRPKDDEAYSEIRCPLCSWRPSASSRWCCDCGGTPEPFFEGCGMVWNTFSTRGRCPRCSHQWRWTSCLRCHESSLHKDWYGEKGG